MATAAAPVSNPTAMSKLEEILMTTGSDQHPRVAQKRVTSSKRTVTTLINSFDQSPENNTSDLQQSKPVRSPKSTEPKDKLDVHKNSNRAKVIPSPPKPESESEEVYTALSNNDGMGTSSAITPKPRSRYGMGDGVKRDHNDDADEESIAMRAIMINSKATTGRVRRSSTPSNNSAMRVQQQGMGDHHHHHTNTKQHKSSSKTTTVYGRKHHRNVEQQQQVSEMAIDENSAYCWRVAMYVITTIALAFIVYRFLLAIWPKPKKTLIEQLFDNLANFFTL